MIKEYLQPRFKQGPWNPFSYHKKKKILHPKKKKRKKRKEKRSKNIAYNTTWVVVWSINLCKVRPQCGSTLHGIIEVNKTIKYYLRWGAKKPIVTPKFSKISV